MMTRALRPFGRAWTLLLPLALLPVAACSGEGDDDDSSAQGYETPSVDPSLSGSEFEGAGVWASKQQLSQFVESAIGSGYENQTVVSYKLVNMTANDDGSVTYSEDLCVTELSEVSGSETTLNQGFYDASGPIPYTAHLDTEIGGEFHLPEQIELKGISLANPATDPLPNAEDYDGGDYDGSKGEISDFDNDGKDGFTIMVEGAIDGEIWAVERYRFSFTGTIIDADTISGLIDGEIEDSILDAQSFLNAIPDDTDVYPDDDPSKNFFEMKRVDSTWNCAKLTADRDTLF